jgi:choline kinase
MRAIMLAAGVGQRLQSSHQGPKCLLEFGGRSLLAHHCAHLTALGVDNLTICVGYAADMLARALEPIVAPRILVHCNPDFRLGSSVSLWAVRQTLLSGDDILIMDADVLYARDILARLVREPAPNCFLIDRDFVPGDEPVKICLRNGRIVEFSKRVATYLSYDTIGESVGFFKFDTWHARELANLLSGYVANGRGAAPHEEALRDLALARSPDMTVVDVTGLAWIEIDYPTDIIHARQHVLPRLGANPAA